MKIEHTVIERFLRYVKIDTQSDPNSKTFPSTAKQKDLSKLLVKELKEMGIKDAEMDKYGYVYATIPSNIKKKVPVICFCAHVDTAPDASGTNVKPIIHKNYDGGDIVLPDDNTQIISPEAYPDLKNQIGNDIITAGGKTLLGADDKAGVAEIMDFAHHLMTNPKVKHGTIKILFTPDEEIGAGVDHVDLKRLGADFAYTVDGERLGSLEDETFSADGVTITIHGVSQHPGYAKGKLENAIKIAAYNLTSLPMNELSPETTEGREGFIHPISIEGIAEKAVIKYIIRDFTVEGLEEKENLLRKKLTYVMKSFPGSKAEFVVQEQYRNMKEVLDKHPQVIEYAEEAMRRANITPIRESIRGGTDGSRLSFMGLPAPNIFDGGHAFHSKHEWASVQDMEKAVETLVHLAMIWAEK